MNQIAFVFLMFFSLVCYNTGAQSQYDVSIDWLEDKEYYIEKENVQIFNFSGAYYEFSKHHFPLYKNKIRLPENTNEVDVQLSVIEKELLSNSDLQKLTSSQVIDKLSWRIVREGKIPYLVLSFLPITEDSKVLHFSFTLNLSYSDYSLSNKSVSVNSVLNEGDWYKIKVNTDGLYKIDRDLLSEMGVNVSNLDPRNIQIYGNGGAMLPEYNATFRHETLEECAIYVRGEQDASFDSNDLIIFYGESPHRWGLNNNQQFEHILNIYDNNNYYFLHIGSTLGKRVVNDITSLSNNSQVDFYTDRQFYEWEDQNLKHTGREWFGEYFSFSEQYNLNFNFSNRLQEQPIRIKARAVARSSSLSNISCAHNGEEVLNVPITAQINSEIYVEDGESTAEFISNDAVVGLSVSYNRNGNSSAFAYLDYIEVQAKCELKFNGNQLVVSEPTTIGEGNITKFNIDANSNDFAVWDVTNPNEIRALIVDDLSFTSTTDSLKTFIIHNPSSSNYLNPIFDQKIDNQNLLGQDPAELIIITAPEFLEAAQRLADFHQQADGISVNIATTHQIYNEFSSGKQDLIALRSYLKMLYEKAQTEDEIPDNVLLFGDASFDYKGIGEMNNRYSNQNFVPTFESQYSFKLGPSYCTDDFIAFLDPLEGGQSSIGHDGIDIGVGRLVVQSLSEAEEMVDKIIHYSSANSLGDWRTNICFVADDVDDDAWEFRLQENMDKIAHDIDTNYHNYNINKIYMDAYQQVSSSGGQRYPDARQAIIDNVNKGTLIMHYYGHGGEVGWAEERVLELIDINSWENIDNLPVFITATCEFSRYDDSKRISAGEQILLNPNGAGIALFTTTRTITETDAKNLSSSFYKYAIPESSNDYLTFGQVMKSLKNDLSNSPNKSKFSLLGDPALRLPIPQLNVVVTELLNADTFVPIDTIKALSKVLIKGMVVNLDGSVYDEFNGILKPKVFDKPSQVQTLNNDYENLEPFNFELQQNVLYSGNVTVENGLFEFEFVVPKDIAYANGFGKFSFYASNSTEDAIGAYVDVVIGGFDESAAADNDGPDIELFMNNTDFIYGGITDDSPSLYAVVQDDSGINTTGNGIGHDFVATLDENSQSSIVLNHYYESDLDSYQRGTVSYPFASLSEGVHHLQIKVWDVYNNSSEAFTEFLVVSNEGLVLQNLMNYPNPFRDFTRIHFEHNRPNVKMDVKLDIYNMNGQLVKSMRNTISESSYANSDFIWYGDSDTGTSIISGMYLCKVSVASAESDEENVISSQMVIIK